MSKAPRFQVPADVADVLERVLLRVFFIVGAFALLSLLGLLGWPSVANMRTVDIVRLIATEMCLGAALVALGLFLVFRYHLRKGQRNERP